MSILPCSVVREKDIRKDLLNYHEGIQNLKIEKFIKPTVLDTGIKYSFAQLQIPLM